MRWIFVVTVFLLSGCAAATTDGGGVNGWGEAIRQPPNVVIEEGQVEKLRNELNRQILLFEQTILQINAHLVEIKGAVNIDKSTRLTFLIDALVEVSVELAAIRAMIESGVSIRPSITLQPIVSSLAKIESGLEQLDVSISSALKGEATEIRRQISDLNQVATQIARLFQELSVALPSIADEFRNFVEASKNQTSLVAEILKLISSTRNLLDELLLVSRQIEAAAKSIDSRTCCITEIPKDEGIRVRIGTGPGALEITADRMATIAAAILALVALGAVTYLAVNHPKTLRSLVGLFAASGAAVVAIAATFYVVVSIIISEPAPSPAPSIVFGAILIVIAILGGAAVVIHVRGRAFNALLRRCISELGDIDEILNVTNDDELMGDQNNELIRLLEEAKAEAKNLAESRKHWLHWGIAGAFELEALLFYWQRIKLERKRINTAQYVSRPQSN